MSIDPVRSLGLDVLIRFEDGGQLDGLLERAHAELQRTDPATRGAAFLSELVRGTVQWRGRYDHILARFSRQGLPTDRKLLSLLRLSLHQLLAMDKVPAYAATDQAARLCRRTVSSRAVGYVNGLLQNVRREILGPETKTEAVDVDPAVGRQERLRACFTELEADTAAWLAAWYSHPRWLVDRWLARYGRDVTERICAANNTPVRLCFHVLQPETTDQVAAVLHDAGCPVQPGHRPGCLVATGRYSRPLLTEVLHKLPGVVVQDLTVQEAGDWLLSDFGTASRCGPVLDMCAAPGGKTAVLATRWPGTQPVLAMDNRARRIRILQSTVDRIDARRVAIVGGDGLRPPLRSASCAAVLLDGPCSGTGVLRHHPDGRWRLRPEVPADNGRQLLALAESAVELLAPGGLLLYATCSLEPEENQEVLEALLERRTDLEPAPVSGNQIGSTDDAVPTELRSWQCSWLPAAESGDGFFAARLSKTS